MAVSIELQVFPDVWQTVGNAKSGANQTVGEYLVFTREGLKGVFHQQGEAVNAQPADGASLYSLAGQVTGRRGEMKDIPLDGTKWAFRPGNHVMQKGQYTWHVLIPADEVKGELARIAARDAADNAPF